MKLVTLSIIVLHSAALGPCLRDQSVTGLDGLHRSSKLRKEVMRLRQISLNPRLILQQITRGVDAIPIRASPQPIFTDFGHFTHHIGIMVIQVGHAFPK